jgi:hypothetical protein
MVKIPDRVHNLRTHEIRLVVDGILKVEDITQKMVESARWQILLTTKYILPIARSLGGKYDSILEKELLNFQDAYSDITS